MMYLRELRKRLPADALRGRIGRDQLGMLRFERLEPLHQHVELIVRDHRRVVNVIELAVIVDLFSQLVDLFACVHGHPSLSESMALTAIITPSRPDS